MRRIVHLSDLHFGKVDTAVAEALVRSVNELAPNVVVVSGDLTQRARTREFQDAREFLDRLPSPQIVVPGNHDVPLYNVIDRFARPLEKFQKYITPESAPVFADEEIAIVGINTARSLTIKGGRVNAEQVSLIRDVLNAQSENALKIVVTHHPFDLPEGTEAASVVGRADKFLPQLAACGAEVFLAGHLHIGGVVESAKRYELEGSKVVLVIQAGTAASVRGRGEVQSFNVIEIKNGVLTITQMAYRNDEIGFEKSHRKAYCRGKVGWEPADERS